MTGATTIAGGLYTSGGTLVLPSTTTVSGPGTIQANGGTIDLSKLTTLTGASGYNDLSVNAYNGGEVNLSGVTSQPSGRIQFYADGTGSTIDLSKLTALISDANYNSSLEVQDGATIIDPVLATLNRADLETDSTAGISTKQITSDVSSTITVNGGTPDFSGLTTIDGLDLYANGGTLALPSATSYTGPGTIQANGGTVDLSTLTTLTGASGYDDLNVNAYSGSEVNLSGVTSQSSGRIQFYADGTGSTIDLSKLTALISDANYNSSIDAENGATILVPLLTTLNRVDLTVNGSSTVDTKQIASYSYGTLTVSGGATPDFSDLATIGTANGGTTLEAGGTGSILALPAYTTLQGATGYNDYQVDATGGGEVDLSKLTADSGGRVQFYADGTGSTIDLSGLSQLFSDAVYNSSIDAENGATVRMPLLTTLNRVDLTVNGSSTVDTKQIASYSYGTLTVSGGATPDFSGLATIGTANGGTTLEAGGTGSILALPAYTTLQGATGYNDYQVDATGGGEVDLSKLTADSGGRVQFYADGTGSTIDLSGLSQLLSDAVYNSSIDAESGATVRMPLMTSLNRVDLTINGSSTVDTKQIASYSYGTLTVSGGATPDFSGLATIGTANGGTTLEAGGTGSILALPAYTTLQGATGYNDYQVDATGGGEVDLSKLTADSVGRVQFYADGTGSTIDLSGLPQLFSDAVYNSSIDAENGAQVTLASGTIQVTRVDVSVESQGKVTAGTLQLLPGSSLSGGGTIAANVISAATTSPGNGNPGTLTIDGHFTQYGDGVFDVQIGGLTAGSQFDQLVVTGTATLAGTLNISLINGFTPQKGNSFPIVTYASPSGEFTAYSGLNYGTGGTFQTVYGASNLSLVGALAAIRVFAGDRAGHQQGGRPDGIHDRAGHPAVGQRDPKPELQQHVGGNRRAGQLDLHDVRLERAPDGRRHGRERQPVGQRPLPGGLRAGGEHRRQLRRSDGRTSLADQPAQRGGEHPGREPRRQPRPPG